MLAPENNIGSDETGIGSVDHRAPYFSEFCWVEEYSVTWHHEYYPNYFRVFVPLPVIDV